MGGLVLVSGNATAAASASASASYSVPHASLDGGGRRGSTPHYTVDGGLGGLGVSSASASGSVRILHGYVGHLNDPPIAVGRHLDVEPGVPRAVTLTAVDVEGDRLSFRIVTPPSRGVLSGEAPDLTYTPTSGLAGKDQFTFVAEDAFGASRPAVVTLDVGGTENPPPVAEGAAYSLLEDEPLAITLVGYDPDGEPVVFELLTEPALGRLSGTPPVLEYTPLANATGSDAFTFRTRNSGGVSEPATIRIDLVPVNDAPVAVGGTITLLEDGVAAMILSASDVERDPLTFVIESPPTQGILEGSPPSVTYRPDRNFAGPDEFRFRVSDGSAQSATVTVELLVLPVNDGPTVAVAAREMAAAGAAEVRIPFTLSDPDSAVEGVVVRASSGTPGLVPDGALAIEGAGANRELVVTLEAGKAGVARLLLWAIDPAGGTSGATVELEIPPTTVVLQGRRTPEGLLLRWSLPSGRYSLDASADLRTWYLLAQGEGEPGGLEYLDGEVGRVGMRFYRLRLGADASVGSRVRGMREDGGYRLQALVEPGKYRLEASTDFRTWTVLVREGVTDGQWTYLDPLDLGNPYRFYRLVRE